MPKIEPNVMGDIGVRIVTDEEGRVAVGAHFFVKADDGSFDVTIPVTREVCIKLSSALLRASRLIP